MHRVAIVILNYNGIDYLKQFLPIVITHSSKCRIVVTDNCSTDDSVSFLESTYPEIEVIKTPFNGGYSTGYNYALQRIDTEYYVLLNSDIEVTSGWVEPLLQFMDTNPNVAACQPKILSYQNRDMFEYAGAAGGFIDQLGYPFCRGRIFSTMEKDEGQYNDIKEVFWATGACLFLRAKAFHEQGGLEEDYFAHMEEIDLCWRFQLSGWKVFTHGASKVFHVGGGTLNSSNPRKTYLNFRNGISMLYTNTPSKHLVWRILLRLILDGIAAIKFLFDSGYKHSWAVLKAHVHFYAFFNQKRKRRKTINPKNIPVANMYKGLIVFQYFLKRRKRYSEIPISK